MSKLPALPDRTVCHQYEIRENHRERELLESVTHIGANRGSGHGAVARWQIEPHDNIEDCRFKRIVPVDYAAQHNIDGITIESGIRPDYRLPENQFLCVIPENEVGNVKATCIA